MTDSVPLRLLSNRDQQTAAHAERLFVTAGQRVRVARLQEPTVFSIRRWPEHEVEHGLGADAVGCFAPTDGVHPDRPNAGFKLNIWR
jgi:hypothetical protein